MRNRYQVFLMEQKGWGGFILLFFAVAFAIQAPLHASAAKTSCRVEYIHERLTVNIHAVALTSVLVAIHEKTGIEYVLNPEQLEGLISVRFDSLPLAEGLKKILSHYNYALLWDPGNKPIKVIILRFAGFDNSPGVQKGVSPSPAEIKKAQPATEEKMVIPSSLGGMVIHESGEKGMIPMHSSETNFIEKASAEDMFVTPPTETMVVMPASEEMIVMPPSVKMVVVPPSPEAMASFGD